MRRRWNTGSKAVSAATAFADPAYANQSRGGTSPDAGCPSPVRIAPPLILAFLSCGCQPAHAASLAVDAAVADGSRVDGGAPRTLFTCDECALGGGCLIGGEGGPGTGEIDYGKILVDALSSAHGRGAAWRGPPSVGPVDGSGRVVRNPPIVSPGIRPKHVERVERRHTRPTRRTDPRGRER